MGINLFNLQKKEIMLGKTKPLASGHPVSEWPSGKEGKPWEAGSRREDKALHWAVHLGASRDEDVEGKEEVPSRGIGKAPP